MRQESNVHIVVGIDHETFRVGNEEEVDQLAQHCLKQFAGFRFARCFDRQVIAGPFLWNGMLLVERNQLIMWFKHDFFEYRKRSAEPRQRGSNDINKARKLLSRRLKSLLKAPRR